MALDEALLEVASRHPESPPVLHLYRKTPSVSLGYFQSVSEEVNIEICRELGVEIFRRTSGGGAIYEDENQLIYGLVISSPKKWGIPSRTIEACRHINQGVINALLDFGIKADFVPVNDIVVNGKKISGCAQTRRRGVLLQHGTLLLSLNKEAMFSVLRVRAEKFREKGIREARERVTSLEEVLGVKPSIERMKKYLIKGFETVLGTVFHPSTPTPEEKEMQAHLIKERYGKDDWNFMR